MPGDVITFRDDDHVGIVEKVDCTAVSTIEGNSSPLLLAPKLGRGGPSPSAAPPASTPETGQDATTNTTALVPAPTSTTSSPTSSSTSSFTSTTISAAEAQRRLDSVDRLEQTQPITQHLPHDAPHFRVDYRVGAIVGVASQAKTATLLVEATATGIGMSYPLLHTPFQLGASPPAAAPFGSALSTWNVVDGPPRRRGARCGGGVRPPRPVSRPRRRADRGKRGAAPASRRPLRRDAIVTRPIGCPPPPAPVG